MGIVNGFGMGGKVNVKTTRVGHIDHRGLLAWQSAFRFAADIYKESASFPPREMFGLANQMRRSAVSVVSNIAEGAGRRTTRDFINFLHIARGSLAELETQVLLAENVGLLSENPERTAHLNELGRLLNGLLRGLEQTIRDGRARY